MSVMTISEAQSKLPELIDQLRSGDEVVITRDNHPVAKLIPQALPKGTPIIGRGKGKLLILEDDDSHLEGFEEYM
jgi:prevent-host-death family protein